MKTIKNILFGLLVVSFSITGLKAQNWKSMGPVNLSGQVLTLCADVNNSEKIYAGTAGGGLWYTLNGGTTWLRDTAFHGSPAVSAIVQSPDGTLYVGTGQGDRFNVTSPGDLSPFGSPYKEGLAGDGIYKTTDGGKSYVKVSGYNSAWTTINRLAFDKTTNKLYAATNAGLKVSADGGATFSNAYSSTLSAIDISISNDGVIIFSQLDPTTGNAVYFSKDNGATFTSAHGTNKIPSSFYRVSVAVAPTNSNVMYAMRTDVVSGAYTTGGIYVTQNGGTTWVAIMESGTATNPAANLWYNTLAVNPTNDSVVYAGGTYLMVGEKINATPTYAWSMRLKSNNGTASSGYLTYINDIIFADTQAVYAATDNSIYKWETKASNYFFIKKINQLAISQLYNFAVANDGRILGGSYGNSTFYIDHPNQSTILGYALAAEIPYYSGNYFTSGGSCAFSLLKPESMYFTGPSGVLYRQANDGSEAQKPAIWCTPGGAPATNSLLFIGASAEGPRWFHYSDQNISGLNVYPKQLAYPVVFWESIDDQNSIDSVEFKSDKTYHRGDTICIKSNRNSYPIYQIFNGFNGKDSIERDSSFMVKDIITSRLFFGVSGFRINANLYGAPVFMTTTALDVMNNNQRWYCVFHTADTAEQVIDLKVSKDGDHLFILTTTNDATPVHSIYRVSGFDLNRKPEQISMPVLRSDGTDSINPTVANPLRTLTTDTLLFRSNLANIYSLALDPQNNDNLIYVNNDFMDRIMLIENATTATLSSATPVSKEGTGLPSNMAVYSAIVEKDNDNIAFIGTEKGIYKSENFDTSNPTWAPYNNGIDLGVPVFHLFQQTNYIPDIISISYASGSRVETLYSGVSNFGKIYAATYGLGIFVDETYESIIPPTIPPYGSTVSALKVYPNPAKDYITVDYTLANSSAVVIEIIDVQGKIITSKVLGKQAKGNHLTTLDCSGLALGNYLVSIITGNTRQSAKVLILK
ncbi:MAG: T9SS type A sorting domain-containing protein [Bacteroidales bacterium]|jgi:photosystem II stability/assembly factor-like uncharacterized protein|nr:T9SS type A sorting domain-containing protein [Bacteroidales bacterium]